MKYWLALGLALGAFVSCRDDRSEPNDSAQGGGENVSFSLSAEVSVDDPSLRAIDYKLGNNANGELVPMPQFTDGQEVEVHTILKSSNGVAAAKTLKWRYNATKRKLVLDQNDGHNITVSGFNNDGGVKWYVSGLIGGTLIDGTTRVTFAGERVLKGVDGNVGDAVSSLNVPYAFGWTELSIDTSTARDGDGSHKYAKIVPGTTVKFSPRGALIAYKLGNAQSSGNYTFTPTGFMVHSTAWGDDGEFYLDTPIPASDTQKAMPYWQHSDCGGSMYYTFATGHNPSPIASNALADKVYYAWVIPHAWTSGATEVRVALKGSSSRPETSSYKDYTKVWFTDYTPKATGAQGKVTHGKVHSLTARVTSRVGLPLEYVAEYNLAGGYGLTYTSPQAPGTQGPLRFASSHDNNQSGYYNMYRTIGRQDATYNPTGLSLHTAQLIDTNGASIQLGSKYVVPTEQQLQYLMMPRHWEDRESLSSAHFASGDGLFNWPVFSQVSDYDSDNHRVTAIRYASRVGGCWSGVQDNSFRSAYRYTIVGGRTISMTWHLLIEAVHLGEEAVPTDLATVSEASWWDAQKAQGKVIARRVPAPGALEDPYFNSSKLRNVGSDPRYRTSTIRNGFSRDIELYNPFDRTSEYIQQDTWGFSVRLFLRNLD